MKHIVKKLWWENAAQMRKSAENILQDVQEGVSQSVVISAMRSSSFNTTDELIKIGKLLQSATAQTVSVIRPKVQSIVQALREFHRELIKQDLSDVEDVQDAVLWVSKIEFDKFIVAVFWFLDRIEQKQSIIDPLQEDYTIPTTMTDDDAPAFSILGFWEVLSAKLFNTVVWELGKLQSSQVSSVLLDTTQLVNNLTWEKNVFERVANTFWKRVSKIVSGDAIAIIPWYISGLPWGIEKAVGRGYSDATAAAVAVWARKAWYESQLDIQKSVVWLLSLDPKIAEEDISPRLIPTVNHTTAREITWWAEAKLLHWQTLRKEVLDAGISIRLYDPFNTSSPGSLISSEWTDEKWVQFIGIKDIIQFSVSSTKMAWAWILATIFDKVKDYASVDAVSTSETEVSFTISKVFWESSNVEKIVHSIREALDIPQDTVTEFIKTSQKTLVYCIWQNISHEIWILNKATSALSTAGINTEMASQWALERAMVFSVDPKDGKKAANALHRALIS